MKTKTEAAKVLLKAGWSWDEVEGVLEDELNSVSYVSLQRPFNMSGDSSTAIIYGTWSYKNSYVTNT